MNKRIEFHILQSFPVTCLNRDDVGAPKTAVVGGVTRARVSSQCWKRQVRLELEALWKNEKNEFGIRTKQLPKLVREKCLELGAKMVEQGVLSEDELMKRADICAEKIESIFSKKEKSKGSSKGVADSDDTGSEGADENEKADALIFIAPSEILKIAQKFALFEFEPEKVIPIPKSGSAKEKQAKQAEKFAEIVRENARANPLDIALFGRMVALAAKMNIEAAASFAHAISTHKVANEIEFFTARDDRQDEPGSAHMGSLEFNSATYYRYICLDLNQLRQTLGDDADLKPVIAAFTKALFLAVPAARQTTQTGLCPWEFAKVLVRSGQGVQASFEKPVKRDDGYLQPSIVALKEWLSTKEKQFGSLFGKEGDYEWGEKDYSIDALIADLQKHV